MKKTLLFTAFGVFFLHAIIARADIVKWVDENGKTHYGEKVPEKYRKAAETVDVGKMSVIKNENPAPARRERPESNSEPFEPNPYTPQPEMKQSNEERRITRTCADAPSKAIEIKCNRNKNIRH